MRNGLRSRIDVVCPTFNRSSGIRATIDSVLAQTVEEWTLTVVSDGSTDDTDDIVRSYRDPRVRLLRVPRYGHPGGPRNAGIEAADSPYIAYIDHDDRWLPTHLDTLLGLLDSGAALAATGCSRVDPDGAELDRTGVLDAIWHPELQTANAMFEPSRVGHVRGLAAAVGGWSTVPAGYEDWDLWFRAAGLGYDFAMVTDRTTVLTVSSTTRRNGLRPPHAVVVERVEDAASAERVLADLASAEHRAAARDLFVEDMCRWYALLAGTPRYRRAPGVGDDGVEESMREHFVSNGTPSLLEGLACVPQSGGAAVVLPLWCSSGQHARAIGSIVQHRFAGQLGYLCRLLPGADGQRGRLRVDRSRAT